MLQNCLKMCINVFQNYFDVCNSMLTRTGDILHTNSICDYWFALRFLEQSTIFAWPDNNW